MKVTYEGKKITIEFEDSDDLNFKKLVNFEVEKLVALGRLFGSQVRTSE